jgi:hypothetical protein
MYHEWRREMKIGYWWKPEGKRQLGRWKRRWIDYIMMALGEVGLGGINWIG